MASKYLIYALVDPRDGSWRYVGKSSSGLDRPKRHGGKLAQTREGYFPVHRWIAKLRRLGCEYQIVVLEEVVAENLVEAEREWIAECRRQGVPLLNLTDGGEGISGYRHSEATKAKMSGAGHWNHGRQTSEVTRNRMRDSHLGKKQGSRSSEVRKVTSRSRGGKPFADQFGNRYETLLDATASCGADRSSVSKVLRHKMGSTHGFTFRYLED